ncbi:MAG: putative baseplate assembly protein [Limibaculum sp.]
MNLPAPDLDRRRFHELVREARQRIPRYTPEWTNFNDSDPGMTLVQLHAWMTETILFELNRVPELNYIKFLDLIGVKPRPARPARTELSFTLDKLDLPDDPNVVAIPLGAKVAVDDPALPREVAFETDATILALNAHVGAVIVPSTGTDHTRDLVTRYDKGTVWPRSFAPLGTELAKDDALYLGLLLRPKIAKALDKYNMDRLKGGPLDLYFDAVQVFDRDADGGLLEGPLSLECANPGDTAEAARRIEWQIYTGDGAGELFTDMDDAGWVALSVSRDDTLGLTRSGHLVLEVPDGATAIDPAALSLDFWATFGQSKPPRTVSELVKVLHGEGPAILEGLGEHWEAMGLDDPGDLAAFAACAESETYTICKIKALDEGQLDPSVLTVADWIAINEAYKIDLPMAEDNFRRLYWIRAKVKEDFTDDDPKPQPVNAIRLNTVAATQGSTRLDERFGRSTGRPSQSFTLSKKPVLIDPASGAPDLILTVATEGESPIWTRVDDFYRSKPASKHYQLDPDSGAITFGDGRHGRIPVAGAEITATRYRTGGGQIGNVPEGTITKIKGRIRHVKEAVNFRAAHDGYDAELIEDVKMRAPHCLRTRDRAISAEDFAHLARQTPGVALQKAYALARTAVDPDGTFSEKDGAVTLVVLPRNDQATPQPSEAQLRAICSWLEPRRLITTELHVIGPRYAKVTALKARLTVRARFDLAAVTEAAYTALLDFLDPIKGGADGEGWPFGEDIYHGDLYDRILGVEGVRWVSRLTLAVTNAKSSEPDVTRLRDGYLPSLTRDTITLTVGYG